MTEESLDRELRTVADADGLAAFLEALRRDHESNGAAWQNVGVPACLDAMAAWVRDTERARKLRGESLGDENPFRLCAELLHAAKVYE